MRPQGSPRSVYLVARRDELAFFGGYWAFPGGTVDVEDEAVPISGVPGLDVADSRYAVAAARELFEETGILCVRDADRVDAATRARLRRELLAESVPFAAALARERLEIDGERFVPICRMTTPELGQYACYGRSPVEGCPPIRNGSMNRPA